MLSAMTASTLRSGMRTSPKVESASVTLWATVNAVTVLSRTPARGPATRTSPSTNRTWSMPVQMCSTPITR